jgi:hypothetical protein
MNKKLIIFCLALAVAAMSLPAYADTVIGTWDTNSGDGWVNWAAGQASIGPLPSTVGGINYSQTTAHGVTLGSYSLEVDQAGNSQSLGITLDPAQKTAFMNSNLFSFDFSVAASGGVYTAGWTQIYRIYMNAPGPSWTDVTGAAVGNFYWWGSAGERTQTVSVDYTNFRNAITGTSYIQIILSPNTGGGAPPQMYFDNAKLSGVPEPATVALLGLGGLALLRRKRA